MGVKGYVHRFSNPQLFFLLLISKPYIPDECNLCILGIAQSKKSINDSGNQDGVATHLNPDILECELKWALRSVCSQSSVGKESACNAGDPGSIPGSGRSAGEGIGHPLQYSWASLGAHLVKNPPAMWETWV